MARAFILAILIAVASRAVWAADAPPGTITILEGQAFVYRGVGRVQAQEGLRLALGDIVATVPSSLAQIELANGCVLQLGGATRVLLGEPASKAKDKAADRSAYLMDGWLKLVGAAPKSAGEAPAFELRSPLFEVAAGPAVLVVHATPQEVTIFAERGSARVEERQGAEPAAVALEAGDTYRREAGSSGSVSAGPVQAFIADMPRAFRDSLPSRIDRFREVDVQPRPAPDFEYGDVEAWLNAEPALRRQFVQRWRPKAKDSAFRAALVAGMSAHPEWDRVLFPEKYRPKPPPRPAAALAHPVPPMVPVAQPAPAAPAAPAAAQPAPAAQALPAAPLLPIAPTPSDLAR
jgi:hypothetical protein